MSEILLEPVILLFNGCLGFIKHILSKKVAVHNKTSIDRNNRDKY